MGGGGNCAPFVRVSGSQMGGEGGASFTKGDGVKGTICMRGGGGGGGGITCMGREACAPDKGGAGVWSSNREGKCVGGGILHKEGNAGGGGGGGGKGPNTESGEAKKVPAVPGRGGFEGGTTLATFGLPCGVGGRGGGEIGSLWDTVFEIKTGGGRAGGGGERGGNEGEESKGFGGTMVMLEKKGGGGGGGGGT